MTDKRLRLLVEAVTSRAQQKLRSFGNSIQRFGDQASRNLEKPTRATQDLSGQMSTLTKVATVALADLAIRYGRAAAQAVAAAEQMAASNLAIEKSFEDVAWEYGVGSDEIIKAIKRASKNTIDKYSAMAAASTAMRLGVATDVEEFEKLMKITYMRARETGRGVEEAWGWITRGIGRASPRVLDNLNFLVSSTEALDGYAAALGKSADELSKVEQQEALRNYVLEQGIDDLEKWAETGGDAKDVFEEYHATMAEFRQELMEKFLPAMTTVTAGLTKLPRIINQLAYITSVYTRGLGASIRELTKLIAEGDWAAIFAFQAREAGDAAMRSYALMDDWNKRVIPGMEDLAAKMISIRNAVFGVSDATDDLTEDLEEQQKAVEKGADIWDDYLRDVAEKNWSYTRRVEDAQFSMRQAAERAAFDLMKIERDAGDRRGDLLETAAIRIEADTATHYNRLRYMKQDLMDELADMEWNYQRDRRDLLDRAPWWIRQALSKEFQERERIAKSGDKEALAAFDATLEARIEAIDPVYAKELELLDERYEHQEEIEEREAKQSLKREKDAWRISSREQERSLDHQLRELDRNLRHRRHEWSFHQQQREASERWSMSRLITKHEHSLNVMRETTERRLADISPLFDQYGYDWARILAEGFSRGQRDHLLASVTPGRPYKGPGGVPLQQGLEYVPTTMPAMLHPGEAVLPTPEARLWRAGGETTINVTVNVGGGYTPYRAREVGDAVARQLGTEIRQRSR